MNIMCSLFNGSIDTPESFSFTPHFKEVYLRADGLMQNLMIRQFVKLTLGFENSDVTIILWEVCLSSWIFLMTTDHITNVLV